MNILITGGCGFIGSHFVLRLIEQGHNPIILDDLSNSSPKVLEAIKKISGKEPELIKGSILDRGLLNEIFSNFKFDSVVHFAASKSIGESVINPYKYYLNNFVGTLNLIDFMRENGVFKLVFSSSAAVYGDAKEVPIKEESALVPTNPYGKSKLMTEVFLRDIFKAEKNWNIVMLRYFNPIGAHSSGLIGEWPTTPYNIIPIISDVALGKKESLKIFGNDYPTSDGTCVRDYIHIEDLVDGHLKALKFIDHNKNLSYFNLGTGKGTSVLDLISCFEEVSGKRIPVDYIERREGDVPVLYTDPLKAKNELGFNASRSLHKMCEDTWRWLSNNPNGYDL